MTPPRGHLTRLALRATRATGGLRPRQPSLFEPALPEATEPATTETVRVRPVSPPEVAATPPETPISEPHESRSTPAAAPHVGHELESVASSAADSAPSSAAPSQQPEWAVPATPAASSEAVPQKSLSGSIEPTHLIGRRRTDKFPAGPPEREPDQPLSRRTVLRVVKPAVPRDRPPSPTSRSPEPSASPTKALPAQIERVVPPEPETRTVPRLHPQPTKPLQAPPDVTVTIGRIEVVPPPAPQPVRPRRRPAKPSTAPTLADYLRDGPGGK